MTIQRDRMAERESERELCCPSWLNLDNNHETACGPVAAIRPGPLDFKFAVFLFSIGVGPSFSGFATAARMVQWRKLNRDYRSANKSRRRPTIA